MEARGVRRFALRLEKTHVPHREPAGTLDVIVVLRPFYEKGEPAILAAREPEACAEKVAVLRRVAARSVESLRRAIPRQRVRWSWLANAVSFRASAGQVYALEEHPLVESILLNRQQEIPPPAASEAAYPGEGPGWGLERLRIPELWRRGLSGKGVRVAHLDTGLDAEHRDLEGKLAGWEAFDANGRALSGTPPHDTAGHGTHTAGALVGGGSAAIGVAPGARLLSALVLPKGGGTTLQVIAGIEWAVRAGARVVNLSLGTPGYHAVFEPVIDRLAALGVFGAFAAGNGGLGVTGSPANLRNACAVGAADDLGRVPEFSGGGAFVWGAGGTYVKPDLCAPGVSVTAAAPRDEFGAAEVAGYRNVSGTSMAAPLVAGAAALLWEAFPQATLEQLRQALFETCLPMGSPWPNMFSGRGLLQPDAALRELERLVSGGRSPRHHSPESTLRRTSSGIVRQA